ncbi:thioredoxin family protein [Pontibacter sp. Tf4]|uniref:thioredoxin family protein n=1 Tax=Pontibacter sp. Tf4 TaxID=2761620 RepID=UPI00162A79F5|nr:thioredoxin family protein [Pontibacter sp. Tf4]MBB6611560.1 thioredoxin family protein [Pontibacter sp. Tf4]
MFKKRISLLILLFAVMVSTASQAQTIAGHEAWLHEYNAALKQAKTAHKPILMVFAGSDWCKPCILLNKEVWNTDTFANYAKDNLVLLELDFPRFKKNQLPAQQVKHNEQLAEKYNTEGVFPLVVLLDEEGNVISKTGYKTGGPEAYVEHLNKLLHH